MNSIARWAPLGGIVAVALVIVGVKLVNTPDVTDPASEWTAHFEDSGNRAQLVVASILVVLSAFAFLEFFWALSARLSSTEDGHLRLSNLALASGVAFTAMLASSGVSIGAVAGGHEFNDVPLPSPELMIQIENVGPAMLLLGGGFAASMFVAASSVEALRGGALPRWLGWLGVVIAIVLLFSFLFIPLLAFLVWVVIVSIVQLSTPEPQRAQQAAEERR